MKKTVKALLIMTILVSSIFALAGCGKQNSGQTATQNQDPIVGVWKTPVGDYTYHFNADGTGYYDVYGTIMNFTYKTEGSKIAITYEGNSDAFETTYSIDGDTLNVKDSYGNDTLYKKQ